jgi:hypothetical protein
MNEARTFARSTRALATVDSARNAARGGGPGPPGRTAPTGPRGIIDEDSSASAYSAANQLQKQRVSFDPNARSPLSLPPPTIAGARWCTFARATPPAAPPAAPPSAPPSPLPPRLASSSRSVAGRSAAQIASISSSTVSAQTSASSSVKSRNAKIETPAEWYH